MQANPRFGAIGANDGDQLNGLYECIEMHESGWTIIKSRRQTGSPGSDEWVDYLCFRRVGSGCELTICGFELDAEGNETDNLIADPAISPADLGSADEEQITSALEYLNWPVADAPDVVARLTAGNT